LKLKQKEVHEMSKIYFPFTENYFSLNALSDVSFEMQEKIDQIFLIAKLKNYNIAWLEFPKNLHITFSKSEIMNQISFLFDDNMCFEHIIIDWGRTKSNPINALEDFLKQI